MSTYGNINWDSIVAGNGLLKMFHSLSFIVTMNAMAIIKPVRISDIVYALQ